MPMQRTVANPARKATATEDFIVRDGVKIPVPQGVEQVLFDAWLEKNNDKEPFHPEQHYDYVSAFRAGINRSPAPPGKRGHFPDTYKLPGHPTFSVESMYYKKGMPAGKWEGEKYTPIDRPKDYVAPKY